MLAAHGGYTEHTVWNSVHFLDNFVTLLNNLWHRTDKTPGVFTFVGHSVWLDVLGKTLWVLHDNVVTAIPTTNVKYVGIIHWKLIRRWSDVVPVRLRSYTCELQTTRRDGQYTADELHQLGLQSGSPPDSPPVDCPLYTHTHTHG